jgi:hypothetical protein
VLNQLAQRLHIAAKPIERRQNPHRVVLGPVPLPDACYDSAPMPADDEKSPRDCPECGESMHWETATSRGEMRPAGADAGRTVNLRNAYVCRNGHVAAKCLACDKRNTVPVLKLLIGDRVQRMWHCNSCGQYFTISTSRYQPSAAHGGIG